jgi:hypothetical protein
MESLQERDERRRFGVPPCVEVLCEDADRTAVTLAVRELNTPDVLSTSLRVRHDLPLYF